MSGMSYQVQDMTPTVGEFGQTSATGDGQLLKVYRLLVQLSHRGPGFNHNKEHIINTR